MPEDREVAGIHCMEVLAALDRLMDGDIEPDLRARVTAHVQGCDNCAHFGKAYADLIGRLRSLAPPVERGRLTSRVMDQILGPPEGG